MCGRYYIADKTEETVLDEIPVNPGDRYPWITGEITPGMRPPVLLKPSKGGTPAVKNMLWGMPAKDKSLIINARAETVFAKDMFRASVKNRRCIMPAAYFFEWDKNRNRHSFYRMDEKPIYLCGFYNMTENEDRFVILTAPANDSIIKVHDRMPLMVEKDQVDDWLKDDEKAEYYLNRRLPQLKSNSEYEQLSLFDM